MSDNYTKQAWSLVNEYFHSNQIDPSKLVDHELVRYYLKACQKSTPKGVSISRQGNRLYLRFKTATKATTANNGCNESFTRDGCINALAKALAVFDKLKEAKAESEFWEWYESEIKGTKTLVDDCLTIGDAIEIVKKNYLSGYDKCGRDRSDKKLRTNTLANYQVTYGIYHQKLNPKLRLTGENIIPEITRNWFDLFSIAGTQTLCSKGFKNAYTGVLKLLRDTKLTAELDKVTSYFGTLKVVRKTEEQTIDLEAFLDFRARVLGLNGYELTKAQWRNIESRRSWFKTFCINLIYGLRASEFKAIRNLDEPATIDGYTFKALHDPTNDENIVIIGDGFWVTDTSGKRHYITVKTGNRIARPMTHPDYPNLIEVLGIKDPEVELPKCTPSTNGNPESIKDIYRNRMRNQLADYVKQVGGQGFTQTHALRHLANYHGKLAGLTRDQRALSLGHSQTMNDKYDKHQTTRNQVNLLMADISEKSENQRLKDELTQAQETIKFLEETILFLKKENARLNELLGGNDNLPRIGS
ncbi:hypothetical protein PN466_13810 [Roseofilum reptotaenium CS-1145]|uniref:Uncharacterized protein n=1 Tax=Roseofilum reptotaenium AO1-A TaxID=1925591 RepID=A0A1L9QWA6_9CYAN|nr:hypothetical protein [Roseofilum reptotaenium]MDB9518022.1 hypothetical protein [Roseofilum reptotaenium CS-1145]OJJ26892.1 hypothetical protein BI308_04155 [Roseofilum reptotaenium AO1-A]